MIRVPVSISEAARIARVSRRTVQRALEDGRLSRVKNEFGRYAAGLDLSAVLAAFPARNRKNRRHVPVHVRVVQNVERVGGDWRVVFGALAALIARGRTVDLDLVAASFACLHEPAGGYLEDFCAVLDGREEGRFDPLRYGLRLGWAVRKALDGFRPIPDSISALAAWRGMQALLLGPDAPQSRGRPYLIFGEAGVALEVLPSWDIVQSRGSTRQTPRMGDAVASPKNMLARLGETTRVRFIQSMGVLSAAVAAHGRRAYMRDAWPTVKAYLENDGASARRHKLEAMESLRAAGVDLKTVADLRRGLVKMRKRPAVENDTDALRPDSGGDGEAGDGIIANATQATADSVHNLASRLSKSTVARVMGVSRMTIYYWKQPVLRSPAAPRQVVLPCKCGAEVDAEMEVCPECGALL